MVKHLVIAGLVSMVSIAHADDRVDAETAQRLSILGSAVPAAAIGLGTLAAFAGSDRPIKDVGMATAFGGALVGILTPSLGELYSHRWLNPAIALRAGGAFVELLGLIRMSAGDLGDCDGSGPCHHPPSTYGLLAGGAAMYLGGMVLDVVGAPAAARAWNARHDLHLVPTVMRSTHATTTGLAVALTW